MMYITKANGNQFTWYAGTKVVQALSARGEQILSKFEASALLARDVEQVQADGDELTVILNSIEGIPKTNKPIQTWYGDNAKFIIKNVVQQ